MPKKLRYTVLSVGQGDGNFIELLDDNNVTVFCMISDFGTTSGRSPKRTTALNTLIRDRLNTTKSTSNEVTIDLLILSHADADHYNMAVDLITSYYVESKDNGPQLRIKKVHYSGDPEEYGLDYKNKLDKDGKPMLDPKTKNNIKVRSFFVEIPNCDKKLPWTGRFEQWSTFFDFLTSTGIAQSADIVRYQTKSSSFESNSPVAIHTDSSNGLFVYILVAGVGPIENTNGQSIISVTEYKKWCLIHNADATLATLKAVKTYAEKLVTDGRRVFMMTAPHHGSYGTVFESNEEDYGQTSEGKDALKVVREYTDILRPECLAASSYIKQDDFRHPNALMLALYGERVAAQAYYNDPLLARSTQQASSSTTSSNEAKFHFITANVGVKSYQWNVDRSQAPSSRMMIDDAKIVFPNQATLNYCTFLCETNIYTTLYHMPLFRPNDDAESELSDADAQNKANAKDQFLANTVETLLGGTKNSVKKRKRQQNEYLNGTTKQRRGKNMFAMTKLEITKPTPEALSFNNVAQIVYLPQTTWAPDGWTREWAARNIPTERSWCFFVEEDASRSVIGFNVFEEDPVFPTSGTSQQQTGQGSSSTSSQPASSPSTT